MEALSITISARKGISHPRNPSEKRHQVSLDHYTICEAENASALWESGRGYTKLRAYQRIIREEENDPCW